MPKKRAQKKTPVKAVRKAATKKAPAKKSATKKAPTRKASARPASRRRAGKAGNQPAEGAALSQIEHLISMMVEKEVVEVEYEQKGMRWRVRRAEPQTVTYAQPTPLTMPVAAPAPAAAGDPAAGGQPAEAEAQGEVFRSPMVGTFYRAPSPEAEPFSRPGDKVSPDKALCIIEAMKVMNEIKAEREFEILDVLVKNGESVEFGQPLFTIR